MIITHCKMWYVYCGDKIMRMTSREEISTRRNKVKSSDPASSTAIVREMLKPSPELAPPVRPGASVNIGYVRLLALFGEGSWTWKDQFFLAGQWVFGLPMLLYVDLL